MKESKEIYEYEGSIDELVDEELARLKRAFYSGNVFGALRDVLYYCGEYQKPLPRWANLELQQLVDSIYFGTGEKKKGRHSKRWREHKQDMIDFTRAETVIDCIEHNVQWNEAYNVASIILKGTRAAGSADTMEKSYKRYKKRSAETPGRYYLLRTIRLSTEKTLSEAEGQERWQEWMTFLKAHQSKTPKKKARK
jgi:hypothetical protein